MSEENKVEVKNGMINFACLREECPTPCCGPFGGVNTDLESVSGREFHDIVLTEEDYQRLLANGRSDLVEEGKDGHKQMRLKPDGTCTAFLDGRCSIHKFKPTLCRAYPFYMDMFTGLCASCACPGFGEGWTPVAELREEFESTLSMYKYWLKSAQADLDRAESE